VTDILGSASQFVLWLCVCLAEQYQWRRLVRAIVFVPLAMVFFLRWISPIEVYVQSWIGRPMNLAFSIVTFILMLVFVFNASRGLIKAAPDSNVR